MWDEYELEIELLEPLLGTIPKNEEVFASFVKTKEAEPDELAPEEVEERGWTGFYVDEANRPVLMDYQVKGFLKEAANTIKDVLGLKALRSHLENEVFVYPRRTILAEKVDGYLERPLRAMTAKGPRVSLVRSDYISPGKTYTFKLKVLKKSRITEDVLQALVEYGAEKGLGQWRGGSYGRIAGKLKAV